MCVCIYIYIYIYIERERYTYIVDWFRGARAARPRRPRIALRGLLLPLGWYSKSNKIESHRADWFIVYAEIGLNKRFVCFRNSRKNLPATAGSLLFAASPFFITFITTINRY